MGQRWLQSKNGPEGGTRGPWSQGRPYPKSETKRCASSHHARQSPRPRWSSLPRQQDQRGQGFAREGSPSTVAQSIISLRSWVHLRLLDTLLPCTNAIIIV